MTNILDKSFREK